MKTALYLPLALLLALPACQKNKPQPTTITGQVRTYGTQEAIKHPPVKVQIVERYYPTTWGSGPTYEPVTETWSQEDATFSLSHPLDPEKEYFLAVDQATVKEKFHYLAPTYSSMGRNSRKINSVGGTLNLNYYLSAYGWVEFHFVNEKPQDVTRFAYNFGGGAYEEFYGSFNVHRIWDFAGNWEHNLAFGITKSNGKDSLWQDKILPPPFDTIPYEVKF